MKTKYRDLKKEIEELKSEFRKTYLNWKRKHNFVKYPEDWEHFIVFYSDGEYDPPILKVIDNLCGWIEK